MMVISNLYRIGLGTAERVTEPGAVAMVTPGPGITTETVWFQEKQSWMLFLSLHFLMH